MSSAGTKGAISSAASGAVAGFQIAGPWGAAAGGIIGGIGGLISGNSNASQHANSMAWADYNRQMQYGTDLYNIKSSLAIAGINAALSRQAGAHNANQIRKIASYNANVIDVTTNYNIELLDNELTQVWQDLDLDVTQIEMFRARERSSIVADQAASGTIVGQGGNADVVTAQMTQEAIDVEVVQFGADRQAASISNEIAQSRWQGQVAIQQTLWEGEMSAYSALYNSELQAKGSLAGAIIQADANMYSAKQTYMAGGNNINQATATFNNQNTQNMISGLFQAGASYATVSYANKVPTPSTPSSSYSGPMSKSSTYNFPNKLRQPTSMSLATPPSIYDTKLSLAGGL